MPYSLMNMEKHIKQTSAFDFTEQQHYMDKNNGIILVIANSRANVPH